MIVPLESSIYACCYNYCSACFFLAVPEVSVGGEFPLDEEGGQLYVYRNIMNIATLRTRKPVGLMGQPVGIQKVASQTYTCVTMNSEKSATIVLSIEVKGKLVNIINMHCLLLPIPLIILSMF